MFEPAVARVAADARHRRGPRRPAAHPRRAAQEAQDRPIRHRRGHGVSRGPRARHAQSRGRQHHGHAERSARGIAQAHVEAEGPSRSDPSWDTKPSSRRCGGATPTPRPRPCASTSIRSPTCLRRRVAARLMDENAAAPARHLARSARGADRSADVRSGTRGRSMPPARGSRTARPRSISCPAAARPTGWPAPTAAPFSCAPPTAAWSSRRTRRRSSTGFSTCWRRARRRCRAWTTSRRPLPARRRGRAGSTSCTTRRFGRSSSRRSTTAATPSSAASARLALILSCGVIEALHHRCASSIARSGSDRGSMPTGPSTRASPRRNARDSFAAAAPACRRSRGRTAISPMPTASCAPDVAVSEREARLAGQVLRVVMRDLDPGR